MKYRILVLSFGFFLAFSCKKDKDSGPACLFENNFTCAETAPQKQLCAAYFERWFYNSEIKSCQLIRYNGCEAKGFASKAQCDSCECRKN
jgi:hypothetical protein